VREVETMPRGIGRRSRRPELSAGASLRIRSPRQRVGEATPILARPGRGVARQLVPRSAKAGRAPASPGHLARVEKPVRPRPPLQKRTRFFWPASGPPRGRLTDDARDERARTCPASGRPAAAWLPPAPGAFDRPRQQIAGGPSAASPSPDPSHDDQAGEGQTALRQRPLEHVHPRRRTTPPNLQPVTDSLHHHLCAMLSLSMSMTFTISGNGSESRAATVVVPGRRGPAAV